MRAPAALPRTVSPLAVTVLRAVTSEGGQATTRRLVATTGHVYAPRSALRHALRQLTGSGRLVAEPDDGDDVAATRWLITDRGRAALAVPSTEARRLRVASAALGDAAQWAADMARGAPPAAGRYDLLADLLARAVARAGRAAVDAGRPGGRIGFRDQVAAAAVALAAHYPDDGRLDRVNNAPDMTTLRQV